MAPRQMGEVFGAGGRGRKIVVTNAVPPLVWQARVKISAGQSEAGIALGQGGLQPANRKRESRLCRCRRDSKPDMFPIPQTVGHVAG
jgi:hypothetical protein